MAGLTISPLQPRRRHSKYLCYDTIMSKALTAKCMYNACKKKKKEKKSIICLHSCNKESEFVWKGFFYIMLLSQDQPIWFLYSLKKKKKKERKVNKCFHTCDFNEIYIYESLSFWRKAEWYSACHWQDRWRWEFRKLTH